MSPQPGQPLFSRSQAIAAAVSGVGLLVLVASGIYANFFVREALLSSNISASMESLRQSPSLFRSGILAELLMFQCDIILAVAFFVMLKPVSGPLAMLGSAWRLTNAVIGAVGVLGSIRMLHLAASNPSSPELIANFAMEMDMHDSYYLVGMTFFSLGMATHGILLYRSGWFSKWLSGCYVVAAEILLSGALAILLDPSDGAILFPAYLLPDLIAELTVAVVLMITGFKFLWKDHTRQKDI